jgi:Ca-activated chloride channel homolog
MFQRMLTDIQFAYAPFLWLLGIIPLLVAWYVWKHLSHSADVLFTHTSTLARLKKSARVRMLHLPFVLRMFVLLFLILALARPQTSSSSADLNIEAIDIMLALDISGSMLAEDFRPNRLISARETALEFIAMRPGDRIGLSVFSGQSFTLCPLTTDHRMLKEMTTKVNTGMVEDGTAIGDGLATAINRLRESTSVSKVIILLTDGINNTGVIDPLTSAEIASLLGIRVYTIGIGSSGPVPYPVETPLGIQYREVEIPVDEALLQQIAQMTGGRYFWAESQHILQEIYTEIDQMERSRIEVTEYSRKEDKFLPLVLLSILMLGLEVLLKNTYLRTIP